MLAKANSIYHKILNAARSGRGQNLLVFSTFLGVSLVLWFVMSLNEEVQSDISMPLRITNIPDSVTIVGLPPAEVDVCLRARGTQRLKLNIGSTPTLNVDFRAFHKNNVLRLSLSDLKTLARNALDDASIVFVDPDTLKVSYTSKRGKLVTVNIDAKATAGPQSAIYGEPIVSPDTVRVYSTKMLPGRLRSVKTEPIRIDGLRNNTTVSARLIAPSGTRVIPDRVNVTFNVEALIYKTRKVVVETVNVPGDLKLITFPAQVEVKYMISTSEYKSSEPPHMRVVADYNSLKKRTNSKKVRLKLVDVPKNLQNVQLAVDSAEYIIERL